MNPWKAATPDTRWSTGILVGLSTLLLLFGWPARQSTTVAAGPSEATPDASSSPSPAQPVTAPPAVPGPGVVPPPVLSTPTVEHSVEPAITSSSLRVAALLRGGSSATDERALARLYFPEAALVDATAADACSLVPPGTELAISASDLDGRLVRCLQLRRIPVVAFASSTAGILSTRRPLVASVLDQVPLLKGRVGIVGQRRDQAALTTATSGLRSRGVDVVATALLDAAASPDRQGVLSGIVGFELARVDVVLFAVSVDDQSLWGSVAGSTFRYVIADARDSIVNEGYPAALDGAESRTTQRGDWFSRRHGVTDVRRGCTEALTSSLHGRTPSTPELWSALVWCGLSHVVSHAELARKPGEELLRVLDAERVESPVTSDLGPLGTGWGPTQAATVTWRSSCRCFVEVAPFRRYA